MAQKEQLEDTHEHYQTQMDIYNFLLRMNGYDTENYAYLLFYYPKEITETGEVIFDTELIKMPTNAKNGERIFTEAIKILNSSHQKLVKNVNFVNGRQILP